MTTLDSGQAPSDTSMDAPRAEYPRPDLDRSDRWVTLNGPWSFEADGISGEIVVPFAWETEASGVGRTWLEHGTYRRTVVVPAEWVGSRVFLCFGAVHHHATVLIDGEVVVEHVGGYEPFDVDLTDLVPPGRQTQLIVEVWAPADKRAIPHGKQRSIPRDDYDGVSFTPTSGIWQSVWLEARGRTYARSVKLRGDSLTGIEIDVMVAGDEPAGARLEARATSGEVVAFSADREGRAHAVLPIDEPVLWHPDNPHLYRLEVAVGDDRVAVTTGLRRFETRGEELFLNDERVYLRGVLDQGYWPETGLTAPTATDLMADLRLARELGFNLVRKHLKMEEPIWLHAADEMGMLVWAEPAAPSRFSEEAARAFEAQLPGMVERDGNHPSIIIWSLYNEEWGLDWDIPGNPACADAAVRAYDVMRKLDASRPIIENSGWAHVKTDLVDWHYYEPDLSTWAKAVADLASGERDSFPVRLAPEYTVDKGFYASDEVPKTGVPIINSEYGEGFTSLERAWHVRWETQELRRQDRFAGYVYTEFADVEHEAAGLLTEHRQAKDWGGLRPTDVNAETVLIFDLVPLQAGTDINPPTRGMDLGVRVSHHGKEALSGRICAAWSGSGCPVDQLPQADVLVDGVDAEPFICSPQYLVRVPARSESGRLLVWLESGGEVLARAFLDAGPTEPPNRPTGRQ